MKKCLLVALFLLCCLTGCGKSESKHDFIGGVQKDLGWVVEREPSMFPSGMTNDGREIWGDGSNGENTDIFSIVEQKIWGDADE